MSLFPPPKRPTMPHDPPVFYRLPARLVRIGMATEDGYEVVGQRVDGDRVALSVLSEDGLDFRDDGPYSSAELVPMAVFWDTVEDGSTLPEAQDVQTL